MVLERMCLQGPYRRARGNGGNKNNRVNPALYFIVRTLKRVERLVCKSRQYSARAKLCKQHFDVKLLIIFLNTLLSIL
jgi:hypothetical protein